MEISIDALRHKLKQVRKLGIKNDFEHIDIYVFDQINNLCRELDAIIEKYEKIEDAILKLEVVLSDELGVDLDHPLIQKTESLRDDIEDIKMSDDLKAWQDGSLINTDAINKLSLGDLERVSKILEGVK